MHRFWILFLTLAVATSQGGCIYFYPKQMMPILPCGEPSVEYDDAWRQEAEAASSPGQIRQVDSRLTAEQRELVEQYGETLAPPANVYSLTGGTAAAVAPGQAGLFYQQVFYATNRGFVHADSRESQGEATFCNTYSPHWHNMNYGWCEVELPHRERGADAPRPTQSSRRLPALPPAPLWAQRSGRKLRELLHLESSWAPRPERVPLVEPSHIVRLHRRRESTQFFQQLKQAIAASPQQDVLIFVHGFNVTFKQAVQRAVQMAADIPFNGVLIVYSWPSQGGIDNYEQDGEIVNSTIEPFSFFLTDLAEQLPPEVEINILAHSMGNRLLTRSLNEMAGGEFKRQMLRERGASAPDPNAEIAFFRTAANSFTNPPRFKELIFCAPDVEVAEFDFRIRHILPMCERATLYRNSLDVALEASRYRNQADRAGAGYPLVLVEGLDTIETSLAGNSMMGHSEYGSNDALLRDLFAVLKEHRPVSERRWLKEMPPESCTIPGYNHLSRIPQEPENGSKAVLLRELFSPWRKEGPVSGPGQTSGVPPESGGVPWFSLDRVPPEMEWKWHLPGRLAG